MSRESGNCFELLARVELEKLGLVFLDQNVYLEGGEIDLLMQASRNIDQSVSLGEICIIEVKGRSTRTEWNDLVVSPSKHRRWSRAALALWEQFDSQSRQAELEITGFQLVLVSFEANECQVCWNACDLDLG